MTKFRQIFCIFALLLNISLSPCLAQNTKIFTDIGDYNNEQRRRAQELTRGLRSQKGNTCQTHAATALAVLTGKSKGTIERPYFPLLGTTEKNPEEIYSYLRCELPESSRISPMLKYEDIATLFNPGIHLTSFEMIGDFFADNSILFGRLDKSIDDGYPVLVKLFAKEIWDNLDFCYKNIQNSPVYFYRLPHVLIVVGLVRFEDGSVEGYYLRDSGIGATYFVQKALLQQAMTTSVIGFSDRVTIGIPDSPGVGSDGKKFTPIRYFSLNGEWDVVSKSDHVNRVDKVFLIRNKEKTVKLIHADAKPLHWKIGDEFGEIYTESSGESVFTLSPRKFLGCKIPARQTFGSIVENYDGFGRMPYEWTFENVHEMTIRRLSGCFIENTGMGIMTIRKRLKIRLETPDFSSSVEICQGKYPPINGTGNEAVFNRDVGMCLDNPPELK